MTREALDVVVRFDKLPSTPEKERIKLRYLNDEISAVEFCGLAHRYLQAITKTKEVVR